ncbi:MAG: hypothetical protein ACE37J_14075 [Pikeienuella sp.]|uniref:hypothetical protein n=1 Tax=Pikeienuella sp. TaxID=2831957 RepID=UPI003918D5AB
MATPENIWSGIRSGLTYEQNALLRAYGAPTYEERERALDQIARDIAARVERLEGRSARHEPDASGLQFGSGRGAPPPPKA